MLKCFIVVIVVVIALDKIALKQYVPMIIVADYDGD